MNPYDLAKFYRRLTYDEKNDFLLLTKLKKKKKISKYDEAFQFYYNGMVEDYHKKRLKHESSVKNKK